MTKQGKLINNTEKNISKSGLQNSSAWLVPINSLILSMYASYGLVSINKIELATSQAMYSMILKDNVNLEYIYQYLNYLYNINYYDNIVSTGTQANLNAEKVNNLDIYIPNIENQIKLSNLLNKADKLIYLNENLLLQLKQLKKGLMQNMFV